MMNNKGLGRFEVMTIIVLIISIFAFIMYFVLQGANKQRFSTMKENGLSFSKVVTVNIASFHYPDVVYLDEAIDEGLIHSIKNPLGKGECDPTQSKIDIINGQPYTTFLCGHYLIDKSTFIDSDIVKVYEVSDWSEKKMTGKDVQKRKLYNCMDGDRELFDHYYEELYFVYRYNKEYDANAYFANQATECEVVTKTFYRTRKKVS